MRAAMEREIETLREQVNRLSHLMLWTLNHIFAFRRMI
jgi:hypothetical protein